MRASDGAGATTRGAGTTGLAVLLALVVAASGLVTAAPAAAATPCHAGHISLTFDDGPGSRHTARVLDVLAGRDVAATFFVVGVNVDRYPALVRRIAAEGHVLANHTYRHDRLTSLSSSQVATTVRATDRSLRAAGVTPLKLVRPPYGLTNQRIRSTLAGAGYGHIMWTVDPRDWEASASQIRSFVLGSIRNGSVVLLHDAVGNSGQTVQALPGIIDGARSRGFCFSTLDASGRLATGSAGYDWRLDGGPYRDVPPTSTHAATIERLRDDGISQGCGQDRYCPDEEVTRAQMATFLQRALGLPDGRGQVFGDVAASSEHAAAIGAVHEAGITLGCDRDALDFCPNDPIRRDQMASFLARAAQLEPGPVDQFRDVPATSTHAAAVGAVRHAGITRGCTDDGRSYCPGDTVTRGQMASFLVRALDAGPA